MEDAQKAELFERTPIPKAVLTLSVPIVISSLVSIIYSMADTYFVGNSVCPWGEIIGVRYSGNEKTSAASG